MADEDLKKLVGIMKGDGGAMTSSDLPSMKKPNTPFGGISTTAGNNHTRFQPMISENPPLELPKVAGPAGPTNVWTGKTMDTPLGKTTPSLSSTFAPTVLGAGPVVDNEKALSSGIGTIAKPVAAPAVLAGTGQALGAVLGKFSTDGKSPTAVNLTKNLLAPGGNSQVVDTSGGNALILGQGKGHALPTPGSMQRLNGKIKGNPLVGGPRENIDSMGRGYDEQVANAEKINQNNTDFLRNRSAAQRANDLDSGNTTWGMKPKERDLRVAQDMAQQENTDKNETEILKVQEAAAGRVDAARERALGTLAATRLGQENNLLAHQDRKDKQKEEMDLKREKFTEDKKKELMTSNANLIGLKQKLEIIRAKAAKENPEALAEQPILEAQIQQAQNLHDELYLSPEQRKAAQTTRTAATNASDSITDRKNAREWRQRVGKGLFGMGVKKQNAALGARGFDPKDIEASLPPQ